MIHVKDPRWKAAEAQLSAPDPLAYKAFFTEFKQGEKRAKEDLALGEDFGNREHPESIATDLNSTVEMAAEEAITLLKRVASTAKSGTVRVQPQRFCASLSASLSTMIYSLGKIEGYHG